MTNVLINNTNGIEANGDSTIYAKPNPNDTTQNPLTSIYVSASNLGGASIQVLGSPIFLDPNTPDVWVPLTSSIAANGVYSFSHRYGKLKLTVTGATENTTGLNAWVM